MDEIIFQSSPWKNIGYFLLSLGFVIIGNFMLLSGEPPLIAWSCILFFGLGIPIFGRELFDRRPRIILSHEGIFDRTLGVGVIRWEDVEGAFSQSINGSDFICLHLRNPERYVGKLSPAKQKLAAANASMGFTPLSLNLSGVQANTHQVLELILARVALRQ